VEVFGLYFVMAAGKIAAVVSVEFVAVPAEVFEEVVE